MESRSSSTSEEKRQKISDNNSNQSAADLASSLIEEYTCAVTTDVLFEPVMISGCGHLVEGKIASKLRQCPHCREGEKGKGITVVAKPAIVISTLAKILAANPTLWQKVYLDPDYLAEVLRKDELKTSTGERFINLLENNTEENLNGKALDGKQKDKSVIEILASFYAGRELLRNNKKIQRLISEATKQLQVNGKTIDEWLKMEKEEPEVRLVSPARASGLFAASSASSSSSSPSSSSSNAARPASFQPASVWQCIVYGNEEDTLQMLRVNPHIEETRTVIDYSGRTVDNATPFQMALRAGDEIMAEKIKVIYLSAIPDGPAELDRQFNEVFPNGYAAHLQEQKQSADAFERDYLNPLVEAITNASPDDLQAALDKRDNGSALFSALNKFKAAFTELSLREKIFNPYHLLKTFEKYNAKFDAWYVNDNNPHRWLRLDLFWRQVIGWEERYMTANYAQSFCTGLGNMVDNNQPLRRTLNLHNYDANRDISFFPLDVDPLFRLGSDFAVYSYLRGRGPAPRLARVVCERAAADLQNLCRAKTATLGELCSQTRSVAQRRVSSST